MISGAAMRNAQVLAHMVTVFGGASLLGEEPEQIIAGAAVAIAGVVATVALVWMSRGTGDA